MVKLSYLSETTSKACIHHDDGSVVECVVGKALGAAIQRLDWADDQRERRHRKREKSATDANSPAESWWQTKRLVPPHGPTRGVLYFGDGAIWDGPDGQWLDAHGEVGRPELNGDHPKKSGRRCRFCGHMVEFPANGVCLNDGCVRERRNRLG